MEVKLIPGREYVTITPDNPMERYGTETAFWYALKKQLVATGHDVIKVVMCKDKKFQHMYGGDSYPYYIRSRRPGRGKVRSFYIYDGDYAIRALHLAFNERARSGDNLHLLCGWDIFGERENKVYQTPRWFVGVKGVHREAFRSEIVPTGTTHGDRFYAVIGPFRTKRGAQYMAEYGGNGNPHLLSVADAERIAKQAEVDTV